MEWHTELPKESGRKIVSVQQKMEYAQELFLYLAYFNQEDNSWYKYDPFDPSYKPKENITHLVNAWASDIGVFMK